MFRHLCLKYLYLDIRQSTCQSGQQKNSREQHSGNCAKTMSAGMPYFANEDTIYLFMHTYYLSKSKKAQRGLVALMGVAVCSLVSLAGCDNASSKPVLDGQTVQTVADGQRLCIGDSIAVAQTEYGRVRGFVLDGIYNFRGIPYGASTGGKNRFMPPHPPTPWQGIRPAVFWGDAAPQPVEGKYTNTYGTFTDHWNYYDVGEDCLRLSVWTPALADGKRRPVLVWIHGGGFVSGNGIEQDGYNGQNLSRSGDIVFVSINHRLGALGFSDFSVATDDARFADSGNAGTLDMVAALRWVHNNIANFGGDPGNVTIMGQSGGGAKVCILTAMPETAGLIHKAVALSGNTICANSSNYSTELGKEILKEAGLQPGNVEALQQMPWQEYLELANRAARKYQQRAEGTNIRGGAFGPVGDGMHIPMGTFFADPEAPASKVPMLLCTTNCEWSPSRDNAQLEQMTWDELQTRAQAQFGYRNTKEIIAAYRKLFPKKKPIEVFGLMASSREAVIATANAKCRQQAPVYLAWFGWNPPLFDGRMRAFHCLDICFWLKNTDVMLTHRRRPTPPRAVRQDVRRPAQLHADGRPQLRPAAPVAAIHAGGGRHHAAERPL